MKLAICNLDLDDLTALDLDDVCALEYRTNGPHALGRKSIRAALVAADHGPQDGQSLWAAFGARLRTTSPQPGPLEAWAAYVLRKAVIHVQRLTITPAALEAHADAAILQLLTEELADKSTALTIWTVHRVPARRHYTPDTELLTSFGWQLAAVAPQGFGPNAAALWVNPQQSGLSLADLVREAT